MDNAAQAITQTAQTAAATAVFFNPVLDRLIVILADSLLYFMAAGAVVAVIGRVLVYYTVRREDWFAREFEKRINRFMERDDGSRQSFFVLTKRLLEQTFYELFEVRGIMKRRKIDYVTTPTDRVFLIHSGAAFLVKDTLKQVRFLRYGDQHPKFLEISKSVFQNNPCFNRVFGVVPAGTINDLLSVAPGLFVVGGIFGTFLGIMKALPELGGMNLNDAEGSKLLIDGFLLKVSFSMSTSAVGIFLSLLTTVFNTLLSPEKLFVEIVNRYELALEYLWRRCDSNELPDALPQFDENRDPLEALAELALNKEIARRTRTPMPGEGGAAAGTGQAAGRTKPPAAA